MIKIKNYVTLHTKEGITISDLDKVEYWKDLASYDLETAKAMLHSKRYLYVGFMCNQVIEKMLKAYYVKVKHEQPPYTHKLTRLAEECNLYKSMSEDKKEFMFAIMPLHIEARYPTQKKDIFETLSESKCIDIINKTEEMVIWIKKKLED